MGAGGAKGCSQKLWHSLETGHSGVRMGKDGGKRSLMAQRSITKGHDTARVPATARG